MEEIKLKRTGQLPLAFVGEEIKRVSGKWVAGKDQNRYHEITLYRTETSKRYVLAITYHTQWQGEEDQHDVLILGPEQSQMVQVLRDYDPVPGHVGYPKSEHFRDRQEQLESSLRRRFASLVSEILEDVERAEERIE